ncbi:hypothetical protein HYC85_002794 [Camellia sinensis]|uniref:Uncharacterized protein n=1 Tax=Camellia sinensis TaxID=4442 RepID=A0A7J7I9Q4_CAMSI|nr:hypothetical protein HYC85_002794 [Camellia sinensis]
MDLVIAAISPRRCRIAAGLSVAHHPLSFAAASLRHPLSFVVASLCHLSQFVCLSIVFLRRVRLSVSIRMALSFLSVSGRPSASLISCLAAPPAPPPPNPNPTALPSLTCALQCPHFQSCSGCTQEYDLHRPIILDEATEFFNKHGVSDFTFDTCRLWGWRCRAKLAVRGSYTDPLIGLYQEGTHNVVDIPDCKGIAELKVEPYDEDQGTGELRYVQMAVTTYNTSLPYAERYRNGKVQVALVWNSRDENSPSSKKLNALANFLWRYGGANRKVHLIHSVWANFQTSSNNIIFGNRWRHLLGERDFWERVGGIDVSLAPSSFGQANTRAFDSLLQKLQKYVHFGASVADLYAGAVKCIEINKESKLSFEKTAERLPNSVDSSISWHNADTSIDPLSWLVGSDVVVVDPPRKGLDPSLLNALRTIPSVERKFKPSESPLLKAKDEKRPWVLRAKEVSVQIQSKTTQEESQSLPQTLIYISCGWESFKEDCMSLLSSKAWHLDKAHGFNFFPGTQSERRLAHDAESSSSVVDPSSSRRKQVDQKGASAVGYCGAWLKPRQEVILVSFEVSWVLTKLRLASSDERTQSLGRLNGKSRSVAIWVRDEEAGRQSFQIVVTIVGRQHQSHVTDVSIPFAESIAALFSLFARPSPGVLYSCRRTSKLGPSTGTSGSIDSV